MRPLVTLLALAAILGAVLALDVAPARAATPAEVENLIRQGVEQRQKGHDQVALPFFQRAFDLEHNPRTAAQLGLAELSLGYTLAAEEHISEALASPRHYWVMKNRDQLEASLKEARATIGAIEISGAPAGATVLVNGKLAGTLPLDRPVRAPEGFTQVNVRAPGFDESVLTTRVTGGAVEHVSVALVRSVGAQAGGDEAASGDTAKPRAARASSGSSALLRARQADARNARSSSPGWVRPTAWVATALAVAGLSVGGYGLFRMEQSQDAFNDRRIAGTSMHACATNSPNKGDDRCYQLYQDSESFQRLGILGLQAAGLFAIAATMGFLWSADHADHADHKDARLDTGPVAAIAANGITAGWRGQF